MDKELIKEWIHMHNLGFLKPEGFTGDCIERIDVQVNLYVLV